MAFFGGLFDDDPIFGGHMRQMNQLMGGFGMFGDLSRRPMQQSINSMNSMNSVMPFGFPGFNSIMQMGFNDPNCMSFSSSTFTAMTNGPDGQPQIYRSSESTRVAPGGLKETKKSVSDTRTGTKRLAVGRHIGDRGHVRERIHNFRSGEREDTEDFINLEEEQAGEFNREWQRKTRGLDRSAVEYPDHQQLALTAAPHTETTPSRLGTRRLSSPSRRRYNRSPSPVPIIEEPDDEEENEDDEVVVIRTEKTRKRRRDETIPGSSHHKNTKRNTQR